MHSGGIASTSGSRCLQSAAFAPVSALLWLCPLWRRHGGGVYADAAPVDLLCNLQAYQEQVVQGQPNACVLPVAEPAPTGTAAAALHLLGQHQPRDAALEDEQDARQRGAVGYAEPAAQGAPRHGR
jgi:hypothetical protein